MSEIQLRQRLALGLARGDLWLAIKISRLPLFNVAFEGIEAIR